MPQALALAISAAFYPPALLVPLLLAGRQPAAARTGLFRRRRDADHQLGLTALALQKEALDDAGLKDRQRLECQNLARA